MADIKLIVMVNNESWFWAWNDVNLGWEAFYEIDEVPAARMRASDRATVDGVLELMKHIAEGADALLEQDTFPIRTVG